MKPSIFLALFLGIIFAQMMPAYLLDSDDEDASDSGSSEDENSSDEEESVEESEEEDGPALTCLLFDNLGCNTECTTIASAFSIKGSGECTEEMSCKCSLEGDDTLEGLFRAKFEGNKAEAALKKIQKDDSISEKVLEVLRKPFQTVEQTKEQIRKVTYPAIYDLLIINDKTPAFTRALVEETGALNQKNIKDYVAEKLKPILKSSAKQLKGIEYKSKMKKSMDGRTDKDLQSIVNEVRRTKNKKLSDIVDAYLKSNKIKEKPSTEKDTLADAMGYLIIDTFVKEIENKKKPVSKKPAGKSSSAKGKGKKKSNDVETPKKKKDTKPSTSNKGKSTKKNTEKKSKSTSNRFELPNFDKDFLDNYGGSIDETFEGKRYTLQYQMSSGGSMHFNWKKNSDVVDISVSSGGSNSQTWNLDDAVIKLHKSSGGSISQVWDFGKTKYTYSKSSGGSWSRKWDNGKKDEKTLSKYKELIDQWCDENDFLFTNPEQCTIY